MRPTVKVKKTDDRAVLPTYGSEYAAGADLYAVCDAPVTIEPAHTVLIHTGLSMLAAALHPSVASLLRTR